MAIGWDKAESIRAGGASVRARASEPRLAGLEPEEPRAGLDELVLAEATREQVERAIAVVRHRDLLMDGWGLGEMLPWGRGLALNLYGPPGTGKTHCAHAIARALGRKILEVDYAELESKYVGDTPKNIKAAFDRAQETGAILFFDEADSLLGQRLTAVTQSADHAVNVSRSELLKALERFEGVVVFATNLARNYDRAFVRRIHFHVELPLPDRAGLERLWAAKLPARLPREPGVTPAALAGLSEGLSGGELVSALRGAASRALLRTQGLGPVLVEDFATALAEVRKAKDEVGREPGAPAPAPARTRVRALPFVELPEDVREELLDPDRCLDPEEH
ncbi:MAG TPA: ATP-binding protein [Myxococcota bacterium]|nr:ATP-binding protein [Myxococcota bacterium]